MNADDDRVVVVRPVDWGPPTRTGRIIDLSPQVLDDLGLVTDDEVHIAFAVPGTPTGIVTATPIPPAPQFSVVVDNDSPNFSASGT